MSIVLAGILISSCGTIDHRNSPVAPSKSDTHEMGSNHASDYKLPDIDLSNWKVTLPIGDPSEIVPPEILDYPNISILSKYMYNDSIDGSLVFYTEPGSTTPNARYSRTELREQLVPGSNEVNWTFDDGANMKAILKVNRVSGDEKNLDRIIVLQIHGRLTDEQRGLINEDDNNAPPILKIYWDNGKINVRRKVLKNVNVDDINILKTSSWTDQSHWFETKVDFDKFTFEIDINGDQMKVRLFDEEITFNDVHTQKWSIFENYFKAGNYLQSTNEDAFSEVKFYQLEVIH